MKEQYIISETVEEQIKVLQLLEKLGYLWPNKKKPTKLVPLKESTDEYANVIYLELDNKIITHSDEEYLSELEDEDIEEITYEELVRRNKKVIL